MKKINLGFLVLLTALTYALTACEKDEPVVEKNKGALIENMVSVEGIDAAVILIDNTVGRIDVEIPYENATAISNLTISFIDLPQGISVTPNIVTGDFTSTDKTVTATFVDGSSRVYTIHVEIAKPTPHFITFMLDGVPSKPALGTFTVKQKASSNLAQQTVEFTLAPEGTTVEVMVDGKFEPYNKETKYNFSDKINGVTFRLTYQTYVNNIAVKVNTSGYARLVKVWGDYANPATSVSNWYGKGIVPASPSSDNWDRNLTMDDNYIYFARANKGAASGEYGIIARNIASGETTMMSKTGMYVAGESGLGAHGTTDIHVIGDKIVACNLANAANNNLKVFVWDNVTADPRIALTYNIGAAPNPRLGDKFSFTGDMNNGKLYFVDYTATNNRYYVFTMAAGKINPTPEIVTIPDLFTPKGGNSAATVQPFSETEWLLSGTGKQAAIFNPITKSVLYTTLSNIFPSSEVGDAFFTYNDQTYLAFVMSGVSFFQWNLRVIALTYPTLKESIEKWNQKADLYNLSEEVAATPGLVSNGNATGKVVVRTTAAGKTYIAAMAGNQGVALFELKSE